ncbi:hypothetical protein rosag_46730 [Roseisolibacter agri]|uniref:Uncharacterized protein n=1 Tax=Roseisolibacter agri TaxID=2014610 RepID=A0AA37Q7T4_9BACT|nr:hypothetical protein rosag_46730 [Roseisolibacter agri]
MATHAEGDRGARTCVDVQNPTSITRAGIVRRERVPGERRSAAIMRSSPALRKIKRGACGLHAASVTPRGLPSPPSSVAASRVARRGAPLSERLGPRAPRPRTECRTAIAENLDGPNVHSGRRYTARKIEAILEA